MTGVKPLLWCWKRPLHKFSHKRCAIGQCLPTLENCPSQGWPNKNVNTTFLHAHVDSYSYEGFSAVDSLVECLNLDCLLMGLDPVANGI